MKKHPIFVPQVEFFVDLQNFWWQVIQVDSSLHCLAWKIMPEPTRNNGISVFCCFFKHGFLGAKSFFRLMMWRWITGVIGTSWGMSPGVRHNVLKRSKTCICTYIFSRLVHYFDLPIHIYMWYIYIYVCSHISSTFGCQLHPKGWWIDTL